MIKERHVQVRGQAFWQATVFQDRAYDQIMGLRVDPIGQQEVRCLVQPPGDSQTKDNQSNRKV